MRDSPGQIRQSVAEKVEGARVRGRSAVKLILYNPPSSPQRKPVLPLSLLALAARLEGRRDYRVLDGNLAGDPLQLLDRAVRETGAELLAVTVMPGPQLGHAVADTRRLKQLHPTLRVVWGGYFPTQHAEVCLRSGLVDYVVRGYGEIAMEGLLDRLAEGADPKGVPGLAWSEATGEVHSDGLTPMPHPDEMPPFPYHRVEVARYPRRTFLGTRTLSHHSSYGCPFRCNFCAVVNLAEGRWLAQSAERTAETVSHLAQEWGADAIEFHDNNFFVSEERTTEFAERIRGSGIAWWGESRVDTLLRYSNAAWRAMRESGLKMIFLGAESGSDEVLRRMNKGGTATAEKTLELAEKMRRFAIVPEFSFVLGNPPDPEADAERTISFIRRVKRVNPASEVVLYLYTPVPLAGSLYEEARASGFEFPQSLEDWVHPPWSGLSLRRGQGLPWISPSLRKRIGNFEKVLNAYYPTVTDMKLGRTMRLLLRSLAAWRYHLRLYDLPVELAALQRVVRYQRPETTGF